MPNTMKFSPKTMQVLKYIDKHHVDTSHLKKKFGDTCHLRLQELQNAHVINYEFKPDGITHVIVPSIEGVHFLEDFKAEKHSDTKLFVRRSVIVPILVSLATNGAVFLAKWLLPLIGRLLTHTP